MCPGFSPRSRRPPYTFLRIRTTYKYMANVRPGLSTKWAPVRPTYTYIPPLAPVFFLAFRVVEPYTYLRIRRNAYVAVPRFCRRHEGHERMWFWGCVRAFGWARFFGCFGYFVMWALVLLNESLLLLCELLAFVMWTLASNFHIFQISTFFKFSQFSNFWEQKFLEKFHLFSARQIFQKIKFQPVSNFPKKFQKIKPALSSRPYV